MSTIIKKENKLYLLVVDGDIQIDSKGIDSFIKNVVSYPELISSYKLDEIDFEESINGLSSEDINDLKERLNDKIIEEQANFFSEEYQLA